MKNEMTKIEKMYLLEMIEQILWGVEDEDLDTTDAKFSEWRSVIPNDEMPAYKRAKKEVIKILEDASSRITDSLGGYPIEEDYPDGVRNFHEYARESMEEEV